VRILLSLVVVLSGLLMAREFMAHSNEQLRLALRGAKVVSEQSIGTVREPPALVAPMAAARIAEVPARSITSAHEPPATVAPIAAARIAEVSAQSITSVHEPPALVARMAVARIAEVSEQSVATVHELPAPVVPTAVARIAAARIAEVAEQDVATVHEPSECEQIWDQLTQMTREEWAEVCRRVDAEKQADINETTSILPGG